jgi:Peptidase family M28
MTAMTISADGLRRDVEALCANGPRNTWSIGSLRAAARLIEESFIASGYQAERHVYAEEIGGVNIVAECHPERSEGPGGPGARESSPRPPRSLADARDDIIVIGAHYDSVFDSPGADDNASGVAALLALARRFAGSSHAKTLRFVAFANEEPPHFQTPAMGSYAYARRCHERGERIEAMLSLEMLGYFDDRAGSQQYPPPLSLFYPRTGDFIGFAGNLRSRALVRRCVKAFRKHARIGAQSAALPELIPQIGWSDQWSFWQFGWPGLMVTDTALFRNPHYHTARDLPPTLDYERMALVVEGLAAVISELARD